MATFLWFFVVVGGPILIALVLAYGMLHSRRLTRAEEEARNEAVREMYDAKDNAAATRDPMAR